MNVKYIEKNLSLLKIITPTFNNIKELHEKLNKNFEYAFIVLLKKIDPDLKKANKILLENLNKEDFLYCLKNNYKLMKYIENQNTFVCNNKYIQENPNDATEFLKKTFSYTLNNLNNIKNLTDFILKMNDELQKYVLDYISDHKTIMLELIKRKDKILFPETKTEKEKTINFLKNIKTIPKNSNIEKDILELFVKKIEPENENLVKKLIENPFLIVSYLKELTEAEQIELFNSLSKKDINYRISNFIDKKNLIRLTKNMTYEELRLLNLNENKKNEVFLNNIKENLYLIGDIKEYILKSYFSEIRKSILSGTKIGKQGLKYFLIKNKNDLDKELIEYVLKKYPKFYKSLKIKIEDIKCEKGSISKEPYKLKTLVVKKSLNELEKEYIKANTEKLMKMELKNNYNEFVLNIIKETLN